MRHALEDQETKGRVVAEEIAVGGQVVCHRQSDSLSINSYPNDGSSKPVELDSLLCPLVHGRPVPCVRVHVHYLLHTVVILSFEDLAFACLYMISIKVSNSSLTQIEIGHLRR